MNEQLKLFHEDATGARKEIKKERFDLIPPDFLIALAKHYGNGAAKYEDRNWEKGYPYSLSYAALQRHANAWWNGEDNDGEEGFGQSHLIAAAWHCIALWWFHEHEKGTDDRPLKEKPIFGPPKLKTEKQYLSESCWHGEPVPGWVKPWGYNRTCWYTVIDRDGYYKTIAAETPEKVIEAAWNWWYNDRSRDSAEGHNSSEAQQLFSTVPDSFGERHFSHDQHTSNGTSGTSDNSVGTQHSGFIDIYTPKPGIHVSAPLLVGARWL
jgi:hypothetical protein